MIVALAYYLLFVSCTDVVWSQTLTVRWNDQILVDDSGHPRSLVYLNDIDTRTGTGVPSDDGERVLICKYLESDSDAGWRKPNGNEIALMSDDNSDDFRQFRETGPPTRVQLARTRSLSQDDESNNGLWTCNGGGLRRYVPLYTRGSGIVMIDSLTLGTSPSFSSTSPRFTLIADTSGGPATNFFWKNNAGNISNDTSNRILIEVNPNSDATGRMNSHYRSTLEVTAVAPGNYTYVVSNRDTTRARISFIVEGGSPSNLQGVQTGMNTVELTWDPPPGPPSRGYRVVNSGNSISMNAMSNHLTINELPFGEHVFQVTSLSQHFPGGTAGPEAISVRGTFTPVVTLSELTATSVRVSWSSPPMFSFTVTRYEVAVRRLTQCSSVTDISGPRSHNTDDRVELFEGLEEYIDYTIEVTAIFQSLSSFTVSPITVEMEFTTLPIAPSEVPSNVVPITTSRTISVSWNAINCRNQNGPNFRYEVDFQRMEGGAMPVQTVIVAFAVEGLQPFTNYTFRVRGVNDFGDGNYTGYTVIQTDEDVPGIVSNFEYTFINSNSLLVTWSPPQEPNGIIIMYELTYLLNQAAMSENISSNLNYVIVSHVNIAVTGIRLRSYTRMGPGIFAETFSTTPIMMPLTAMNVRVNKLDDISVIVSWDRITEIPGITEYIVYYAPVSSGIKRQDNEQSVRVPSMENSVEISCLKSTVEYQYQVAFEVVLGGQRIEGERSLVDENTRFTIMESGDGGGDCQCESWQVSVSVVATFLLTIILYSALLLIIYFACAHYNKRFKKNTTDTDGMAMKENAAYGPVTSSQQPHDYVFTQPDAKTESEYDIVK